jgi:hypothetical protein
MRVAIPPLPNTPSWRGAQLKHRDNFTFTLRKHLTKIYRLHTIQDHKQVHLTNFISAAVILDLSLAFIVQGQLTLLKTNCIPSRAYEQKTSDWRRESQNVSALLPWDKDATDTRYVLASYRSWQTAHPLAQWICSKGPAYKLQNIINPPVRNKNRRTAKDGNRSVLHLPQWNRFL